MEPLFVHPIRQEPVVDEQYQNVRLLEQSNVNWDIEEATGPPS